MNKPTVLVTGASRGLGKQLVEDLIREGYRVISCVRKPHKAPEGSDSVYLDLSKEKSMIGAVETIAKKYRKVDILIHNAGIAYLGPVDSMTLEQAKDQFEVNFFGVLRLTQLILPMMRKRRSGKILFVSSVRAVDSGLNIGLYSASKAALEATAVDWAIALSPWNISVSIYQPGPIDSKIIFKKGDYFKENNNPYPKPDELKLDLQTLKEASQAILVHIKNEKPPFKFQSSNTVKGIVESHLKDPTGNEWVLSEINKYLQKNQKQKDP